MGTSSTKLLKIQLDKEIQNLNQQLQNKELDNTAHNTLVQQKNQLQSQLQSIRDKQLKDNKIPSYLKNSMCYMHNDGDPLIIPLRVDDNGIFTIDIEIDGQWVSCAVDTGSESLVVADIDCKSCKSKMGHIDNVSNAKQSKIMYGSQQDSVIWQESSIRIPALNYQCEMQIPKKIKKENIVVCAISKNIPVAVVQSRSGSSNYNILGLGPGTSSGPPAFLSALFPTKPRTFAFRAESDQNAQLILNLPGTYCHRPRFKIPLFANGSHHYLVKIKEVRTSFQDIPLTLKSINTVLFDTGANALSLPSFIYKQLKKGKAKGTLQFIFTDCDTKECLNLETTYDLNNKWNRQVVNDTFLDKIIIGTPFFTGYTIGFINNRPSQSFLTVDVL
jgi:hypothetical protein